MIKGLFSISCWILVLPGNSQTIIGEYNTHNESHTNWGHYEELVLKSDNTFKYFTSMEFIRISKEGAWSVVSDTLILNEKNACDKKKFEVEESYDKIVPSSKMRFLVTTLDGEEVNYHLVLDDGDSLRTVWSLNGLSDVKAVKLRKFYLIVNSLVYSPEYTVKSTNSNCFRVHLAADRLFCNEKWLIRNGTIVPMGWDNQLAKYYLKKEK